MTEEYKIVYEEKPEDSAWGVVGHGVSRYNKEQAGDNKFQRLCFVLKDSTEEVVAGVIAEVYWNWLHIDLLCVCITHQNPNECELDGVLAHGVVTSGRCNPFEGFASGLKELLHIGRGVLDGECIDIDPGTAKKRGQFAEFPRRIFHKKGNFCSNHFFFS